MPWFYIYIYYYYFFIFLLHFVILLLEFHSTLGQTLVHNCATLLNNEFAFLSIIVVRVASSG